MTKSTINNPYDNVKMDEFVPRIINDFYKNKQAVGEVVPKLKK